MKWVTVNDMYKYSKDNNLPLLSNFNATFWNDYNSDYGKYDKLFNRMFMSFRYFMQEPLHRHESMTDAHIGEITSDFTDEVYAHLMVNSKKYSELYRINVVDDESFSIVDNYNITENMDKETTQSDKDTYGTHTDTTTDTIGSRKDSNQTILGSQSNTATNKVSPYDSENFYNDTNVQDTIGGRTDSSQNTIGSQSNSSSTAYGSRVDGHEGGGTEQYTLTRRGNIGIRTADEVMEKHSEFWSKWEFYTYIFKEICAEMLLI